MLYLNPNKEKVLTFEVEVSGANVDEVSGFVRFFLSDNVQLGFPAIIQEGQIQAVISPLKELVKIPVKNGTVFEAQLDLYTEENDYFSPWRGEIEVKMPVRVEAKIMEDTYDGGGVKRPSVSIRAKPLTERKIVTQPSKPSKKKVLKQTIDNLTEEQVFVLMEKLGTTTPKIKQILYDQASTQAKSGKPADVLKEIIKIVGRKKVMKRSRG
jgi:hypothetical protein